MDRQKTFLSEETRFKGSFSRRLYQTLFWAYRRYLVAMICLFILGLMGRALVLSNANFIGIWVDTFCKDPMPCRPVPHFFAGLSNQDFVQLLLWVTVSGFALTLIFRAMVSRISSRAVSLFYDEVTLRASRYPIRFYDVHPAGRVVTRFSSDYGNVFRFFGGPLADFLSTCFDLICMIILVGIAHPVFLPFFFALFGMYWVVYNKNHESLRAVRRELHASRSPTIAHFAETVQGSTSIRIFSRQQTFFDRFNRFNSRFLKNKLAVFVRFTRFSLPMHFLTGTLLLVTGLTGYLLVTHGWVSLGSLGVALTFVALLGFSIQMFFEWLSQIEEAMTGVERLDEYLRRPIEGGQRLPSSAVFPTDHPRYPAKDEKKFKSAHWHGVKNASLRVHDLWFRYHSDLPMILKGLDFEIHAGEKIGIIGRTGSGKTSLIQAIFHLYPFESGEILLDGKRPIRDLDLNVYRRAIAYISQDPTLFRGTLRENLTLDPRHPDEALISRLEHVGLDAWYTRQSKGLNTLIEERGRNLSAGERQLLCMARCLLQGAPIVIMDEATSAVDPHSEEILMKATREFFQDKTQIIVAHRLSTIEHCDRILWLHDGAIRALDTPEKVLPEFRE